MALGLLRSGHRCCGGAIGLPPYDESRLLPVVVVVVVVPTAAVMMVRLAVRLPPLRLHERLGRWRWNGRHEVRGDHTVMVMVMEVLPGPIRCRHRVFCDLLVMPMFFPRCQSRCRVLGSAGGRLDESGLQVKERVVRA